MRNFFTRRRLIALLTAFVIVISVASLVIYHFAAPSSAHHPVALQKPTATPTFTPTPTPSPSPTPSPTPTPIPTLPTVSSAHILGVDGYPQDHYPGIGWIRMGYPTCGWGNQTGQTLLHTIQSYHQRGIRVLLTVCQGSNDHPYDPKQLADAAHGQPDAVQCGNEEMKYDASVSFLYIQPQVFARFFDACEHAMHAVRSDIPVLLGSLDPHVGGIDYQPLLNQVYYLNQMQYAMNTSIHPGGHWDWHTQTLGLIDSWHNGYPDSSVNSLYYLFQFWSQQFGVDMNSGALGKHLWVVEGTGCFKGCGIDPYNGYQVAVSHLLALVTDVQTSMRYQVPIFYFSGKDFLSAGFYWPIGVLDMNGHPKPLRQDLGMGGIAFTMSCGSKTVQVVNQEDLLAKMYAGCRLPGNYVGIIYS